MDGNGNASGPEQFAEAKFRAAYGAQEGLKRNKHGVPIACQENACWVLEHDMEWVGALAYDEFSGQIVKRDGAEWSDVDQALLRRWLSERYDLRIGNPDLDDAVLAVAYGNRVHPVRDYLNRLLWDGRPRLSKWASWYLGAEDTLYTELAGVKWMVSAVARVMQIGAKTDHVMILEGKQRSGKSTALKLLAEPWFMDTPIKIGDKDAYQAIRGVWIVELAELDSFTRAETSAAKAFFSSTKDRYRCPYGRWVHTVPRQCVFAGSTNHQAYFKDDTGNSRYWPIRCRRIDLDRLGKDRDQLWAEALLLFRSGTKWWPERDECVLFAEEQEARYLEDALQAKIANYLKGRSQVTMDEILEHGLGLDVSRWGRSEQTRVGIAMDRLGWIHRRQQERGDRSYYYERPGS